MKNKFPSFPEAFIWVDDDSKLVKMVRIVKPDFARSGYGLLHLLYL